MKHLVIRSQLVFASALLLLTFAIVFSIVTRHNARWDATREKIFSLSEPTARLLEKMSGGKIEVWAFYPTDDPARNFLEVFLKECRLRRPDFRYNFYDPDRVPNLAKRLHVREHYTVVFEHHGRRERVVRPTEESFTNALLRLANPRRIEVCFVAGHDEASLAREDRTGLRDFRQALEDNNYSLFEIILPRDKVPSDCKVVAVAGPHHDLAADELGFLRQAFNNGQGILFLVDPMDPGTGKSFRTFLREFGIVLGEDVIVDKMSRVAGGDFLVPLVTRYVTEHPITGQFDKPTFFPVARSVQPSTEPVKGIEVVPLALTSPESWAERSLAGLENGETVFDAGSDVMGPISLAAAAEKKDEKGQAAGRMVAVGDSDFVTNTYLGLSGNRDLALNMIQWLSKDDRFISLHTRRSEFKPLLLARRNRFLLFFAALAAIPLLFFVPGIFYLLLRKRGA